MHFCRALQPAWRVLPRAADRALAASCNLQSRRWRPRSYREVKMWFRNLPRNRDYDAMARMMLGLPVDQQSLAHSTQKPSATAEQTLTSSCERPPSAHPFTHLVRVPRPTLPMLNPAIKSPHRPPTVSPLLDTELVTYSPSSAKITNADHPEAPANDDTALAAAKPPSHSLRLLPSLRSLPENLYSYYCSLRMMMAMRSQKAAQDLNAFRSSEILWKDLLKLALPPVLSMSLGWHTMSLYLLPLAMPSLTPGFLSTLRTEAKLYIDRIKRQSRFKEQVVQDFYAFHRHVLGEFAKLDINSTEATTLSVYLARLQRINDAYSRNGHCSMSLFDGLAPLYAKYWRFDERPGSKISIRTLAWFAGLRHVHVGTSLRLSRLAKHIAAEDKVAAAEIPGMMSTRNFLLCFTLRGIPISNLPQPELSSNNTSKITLKDVGTLLDAETSPSQLALLRSQLAEHADLTAGISDAGLSGMMLLHAAALRKALELSPPATKDSADSKFQSCDSSNETMCQEQPVLIFDKMTQKKTHFTALYR